MHIKLLVEIPINDMAWSSQSLVNFDGTLKLHEGGDQYLTLPPTAYTKEQISPTRDSRLRWMQSVLHCSHYIAGAGEQAYLRQSDAPEIQFITRDAIDRSDEAYTELP